MKMIAIYSILFLSIAILPACGSSKTDRLLSGGGIGAGAGAVGATVLGANPVTGAILGGVAGAATGVLTDEDDIDLSFD